MTDRANILLTAYKTLDWESYITLCDMLTKVTKDSIEGNLQIQASLYSHYAGLLALASLDVDRAENGVDRCIAGARQRIELSSGKLAEKYMEAAIEREEDVQSHKKNLIEAEYRYNLLHSLVKALDQKKDCLIQMSSNHRAEINLYAKG